MRLNIAYTVTKKKNKRTDMTSLKIQNESIEYPEWNLSVLFKMCY